MNSISINEKELGIITNALNDLYNPSNVDQILEFHGYTDNNIIASECTKQFTINQTQDTVTFTVDLSFEDKNSDCLEVGTVFITFNYITEEWINAEF